MRTVSKVGVLFLLTLAVGRPVAALPSALARPDSVGPTQGCAPWQTVPVPTNQEEGIGAIDGLSGSDFWAVEDSFESPQPLNILHWDGNEWTRAPADTKDGDLKGVSAISATDAWAVGTQSEFVRTEALHWNGSMWTKVPIPSPEGGYDILYGVSAASSSDVWAVGVTGYNRGLIVHWDGAKWSVVLHPEYRYGDDIRGVVALAPDDAWAVGGRLGNPFSYMPIIQHWDGSAWTDVRFPHSYQHGLFLGVGASGPDDVWAVGVNYVGGGALVDHWDGTAWTRLHRVPYHYTTELTSVSALAPDDVWVAGLQDGVGPPVAAHWDGSNWKKTPVPVGNQWFTTIKAFTHTTIWAGGGGSSGILAARFAGCG